MTKDIENIIVRFLTSSISEEEKETLAEWLNTPENERVFQEYIRINYAFDLKIKNFDKEKSKKEILRLINNKKEKPNSKTVSLFPKMAIAAAISLLIVALLVVNYSPQEVLDNNTLEKEIVAISPGTDKAVLTLSNGEQLVLEKGSSHQLAHGTSNGEQLVYNKSSESSDQKIAYNYLTIPRGGQFFVTLADGTKVWLNSESKLKFPVAFQQNNTRTVQLLYGEAYFDVSHSDLHNGTSFVVLSEHQRIEVLGTEFNIAAYQGDKIVSTTLVEGKVVIDNGKDQKTLTPGKKSIIKTQSKTIGVIDTDVSLDIAWKNGYFRFEDQPLDMMMKTLARWYDFEVIFENKSKANVSFCGQLFREKEIDHLLEVLEKTDEVSFEKKGNVLIIR